jgi:hypothetical protein
MTSRISLLAALAILGALTACTPSSPDPKPSATAKAGLGERAFPSAAAVNVRTVDEAVFLTPSNNIGCALSAESVRCDIGRRDWTAPPKPADCDLDYGNGLFIQKDRAAAFICAGDTVLGATKDILEYGHGLRSGDFVCDSESGGLRCADQRSGHGFTLAVEDYTLF